MTQAKNIDLSNVCSLYKCAVTEMEVAHTLWRKRQYNESILILKSSATYLSESLVSSMGLILSDHQPLEEQLKNVENTNEHCYPVTASINKVLTFSPNAKMEKKRLKILYKEYQSALVDARQLLVRNTHYSDGLKQKAGSIFFTVAGLKKLSIFMLPLTIIIVVALTVYKIIDPVDSYDLVGQIFWKTSPKHPFLAKNTIRFPVISDNQSREYTIELDSPERIFMLRLDPVNKIGLSEIEIKSIRLIGQHNELLRELSFDNSMYWSCDNCIKLESDSNTALIQPTSNDPFMTSSKINQDNVKKITITMRTVSRKTFWEWVLNIDKSMQF